MQGLAYFDYFMTGKWPYDQSFPLPFSIPSHIKNRLFALIRQYGQKKFQSNYKFWLCQEKSYFNQQQKVKILFQNQFNQFFTELNANIIENQTQILQLYLQIDIIQGKQQILKNLTHIQFNSLKILVLQEMVICSLQPISWLQNNSLETLVLDENLINNLKPLGKTNFNKLSKLSVLKPIKKMNPFIHSSSILYLNRMKMNKIPNSPCMVTDFNWIRLSISITQQQSDIIFEPMFVKLQTNHNGFDYGSIVDLQNYPQLIYAAKPRNVLIRNTMQYYDTSNLLAQQNWKKETWNFLTEK